MPECSKINWNNKGVLHENSAAWWNRNEKEENLNFGSSSLLKG